jgi:hypothetical protein
VYCCDWHSVSRTGITTAYLTLRKVVGRGVAVEKVFVNAH